jgi:hypothetical protein
LPEVIANEVTIFLQITLDQYRYRRDIKTNTPTRQDIRAHLEKLIVSITKLRGDINKFPWVRPGLQGIASHYEGLMYCAGGRSARNMLNDSIFGLEWLHRSASEWLDHLSRVERGHLRPSELRSSADDFLVEQLLWLWGDRLGWRIIVSDSAKVTKFIVACFDVAGATKSPSAIRKKIERLKKGMPPVARESASRDKQR